MREIRLSDRMQAIVDMVDEPRIADIGCDHAFVSIELIRSGRAAHVTAMDVRQGPLDIARTNVASYGLEDRISIRLSDGFSALDVGEADCAIIAGMGGPLMIKIMQEGFAHLENGIHLILQPQSETAMVRAYLLQAGYEIIAEDMVCEDEKYYTIMKAVPACGAIDTYMPEEEIYGRLLIASGNPVLRQYLQCSFEKNQALLYRLSEADTEKAQIRCREIMQEQRIIQAAMTKMQ